MTLFLYPTKKEAKAGLEFLKSQGYDFEALFTPQKFGYWKCQKAPLLVARGGYGKVEYALACQRFLTSGLGIKRVVCIGGGGGLDQVQPLDVVVATHVIEHDFKEKFGDGQDIEVSFESDSYALNRLREKVGNDPSIHFAPIAGGDEDVIGLERAQQIKEQTKARAVAWEGPGGARACRQYNIPFIEIRAITDMCVGDVQGDYYSRVDQAVARATQLGLQLL